MEEARQAVSETSDGDTMRDISAADGPDHTPTDHGSGAQCAYSGNGSSEGEDDADEDEDDDYQASHGFCINCTGPRTQGTGVCEDCGHDAAQDSQLFSCEACSTGADKAGSGLPCVHHAARQWHGCGDKLPSHSQAVALLYDERMELHAEAKFAPHPERPDRVRAIVARVLASGLGARCLHVPCREATLLELGAVHTESLVCLVEGASRRAAELGSTSGFSLAPDTYVNQHTYLCAKLAAGGAAEVAAIVARGEAPHGAAIIRPPGHHAESGMAMGFCFFNNAAVAARAAQAAGAQRIIILDWDVHHGNGTQHIFEDDPSVLYMSLHRHDGGTFYPGTGHANEVGLAEGQGFTVNVPWSAADMSNGDYLAAFHQVLLPIAYEYNPDLIIVSAGFDAADGDPIGECRVTPECFAHMTSMLKAVAPLVLLLEGGYNLHSTAVSTEACLRVLLGEQPASLPGQRYPSASGWKAVQEVVQVQSSFWKCLKPPPLAAGQGEVQVVEPEEEALSSGEPCNQAHDKGGAGCGSVRRQARKRSKHSSVSASSGGGNPTASSRWILQKSRSARSKCRILLKIHIRAMRAFWKRQRRMSRHADVADQQA